MPKTAARPKTSTKKAKLKQHWAKNRRTQVLFALAFALTGAAVVWWARAATVTYSIWDDNATPKTQNVSDSKSVELGLKFQAKVAGEVTGVRFYKGAQNTGTHTGTLWDSSGRQLATATFANETSSGWQQVAFSQPVSITANTTYIVSYHAPKGHYAADDYYFKSKAYTHNDLIALKSGTSGPNGVYKYSSTTALPNKNLRATNFWVDVVFSTQVPDQNPVPAAPTGLTATQQDNTHVALSWQPSTSTNLVSEYIVYRDGTKLASAGPNTSYVDGTVSVGNAYNYQVQTVDSTGASSALSTAVPITVLDSGSTRSCALPNYPDATCTGVPAGTSLTAVGNGGQIAINVAGTIYENKNVNGCLLVEAPNVIIRKVKINCDTPGEAGIHNCPNDNDTHPPCAGAGLLVEDVEIDCGSKIGVTAITTRSYTARRVNAHGCDNTMWAEQNVTIEDSYLHDPVPYDPVIDPHTDIVQIPTFGTDITIRHNRLFSDYYNPDSFGDAAIISGRKDTDKNDGYVTNILIQDNLLAGGGYALRCFGSGSGTNFRVINNRFSTIFVSTVGGFGAWAECQDETQVTGNVIHETGQPLSF